MPIRKALSRFALCASLACSGTASAFTITLSSDDFVLDPSFNVLSSFHFVIEVLGPLAVGSYDDPLLGGVTYSVNGTLTEPTPSGFPAFALQRTIGGAEFYAQGSSLAFEITPGADLSDGLQLDELGGGGFVFDGREFGTGRYHPAYLELNADGSGLIQNSNNFGGINPGSGEFVDVEFGEEYIVGLQAVPDGLTLAVPEPASAVLLGLGLLGIGVLARRRAAGGLQAQGLP